MQVKSEQNNDTLSIIVEGRVDGSNAIAFKDGVDAALEDGARYVIMDLGALEYVSSAGLRVMLMTGKALKEKGTRLAFCALSEPIMKIFEISGFDKLFAIYPTRDAAVTALRD